MPTPRTPVQTREDSLRVQQIPERRPAFRNMIQRKVFGETLPRNAERYAYSSFRHNVYPLKMLHAMYPQPTTVTV